MDWGFMKIQDFVSSCLRAPYFHKVPTHILMHLQLSNEKRLSFQQERMPYDSGFPWCNCDHNNLMERDP
jgi:hypothetical protein